MCALARLEATRELAGEAPDAPAPRRAAPLGPHTAGEGAEVSCTFGIDDAASHSLASAPPLSPDAPGAGDRDAACRPRALGATTVPLRKRPGSG